MSSSVRNVAVLFVIGNLVTSTPMRENMQGFAHTIEANCHLASTRIRCCLPIRTRVIWISKVDEERLKIFIGELAIFDIFARATPLDEIKAIIADTGFLKT